MTRTLARREFLAGALFVTTSLMGVGAGTTVSASATSTATPQPESAGEVPLTITISDAGVDAEVERSKIVDGQMIDPSGPWVVAWYPETGTIGRDLPNRNTVFAGHVDYWGVGPSVFQSVANLQKGAIIRITGEDGNTYAYEVNKNFLVPAEPTEDQMREVISPKGRHVPMVTLITCGGDFDSERGEYLSRTIVQAVLSEDVNA